MAKAIKAARISARRGGAQAFEVWARNAPKMKLLPGVALNVHPDTWDAVVKIAQTQKERPSAVVRALLEKATHTGK